MIQKVTSSASLSYGQLFTLDSDDEGEEENVEEVQQPKKLTRSEGRGVVAPVISDEGDKYTSTTSTHKAPPNTMNNHNHKHNNKHNKHRHSLSGLFSLHRPTATKPPLNGQGLTPDQMDLSRSISQQVLMAAEAQRVEQQEGPFQEVSLYAGP